MVSSTLYCALVLVLIFRDGQPSQSNAALVHAVGFSTFAAVSQLCFLIILAMQHMPPPPAAPFSAFPMCFLNTPHHPNARTMSWHDVLFLTCSTIVVLLIWLGCGDATTPSALEQSTAFVSIPVAHEVFLRPPLCAILISCLLRRAGLQCSHRLIPATCMHRITQLRGEEHGAKIQT